VGDAILVADFIRLKRAGFKPQRDLIIALTGDEETDGSCIAWLVSQHRDLIDGEFASTPTRAAASCATVAA